MVVVAVLVAGVSMAARPAALLRCHTFPQRPRGVRLTVPNPAARHRPKRHTGPPLPASNRGFPPFKMARLKW